MRLRPLVFAAILVAFGASTFAQQPNKATFVDYENPFWEKIKEESDKYWEKPKEEEPRFMVDYSGMTLPKSIDEFEKIPHLAPVAQGRTGTCWSYSTTSFFESEVARLTGEEVKISEMYTVYWEYVAKARRFIERRGDSYFAEGSEADAVIRIWRKRGAVPHSAYPGKPADQPFHDHSKMFDEMNAFLEGLRASGDWNVETGLETIKAILNHYMGEPPTSFDYKGATYTPQEFLDNVLQLNLNDYVGVISLMEDPYYEMVVYDVPDNWWFSDDYHNVPLDEFMSILKSAVREGYTICIGGDVSEPGMNGFEEVATVPSFDIPAEYITEEARQFRFSAETTTDDHGIHIVGYKSDGEKDWFLVKDSGSGARIGENKGYYFYHEDYVKLKMIDFMVHKDAVGDLLEKF
jgi:bleomycin hydrolase